MAIVDIARNALTPTDPETSVAGVLQQLREQSASGPPVEDDLSLDVVTQCELNMPLLDDGFGTETPVWESVDGDTPTLPVSTTPSEPSLRTVSVG